MNLFHITIMAFAGIGAAFLQRSMLVIGLRLMEVRTLHPTKTTNRTGLNISSER